MFGELACLTSGNMALAASSQGDAMASIRQSDNLVATTKATLVNMRGREMPGWLRLSSANLRSDDQPAPWVEMGTGIRALTAAPVETGRNAAQQLKLRQRPKP